MKEKLSLNMTLGKKPEYPSKTSLNLVMTGRTTRYNRTMLAAAVLVALAIGLFTKFAVLDRLAKERDAWRETYQQQRYLDALLKTNAEYDQLFAQYERYFASEDVQKQYVDAVEVIRIVDDLLIPNASVHSYSLGGNTLSITLKGIDLEQASWIYGDLNNTEAMVTDVNIQSSRISEEENAVAMTITLIPVGGEE